MKPVDIETMVVGVFLSQLSTAHAGVALQSAQLRKLIPGHFEVTIMGLSHMTVSLRENGVIIGSSNGSADRGHWKFSGNQICIGWTKWLGGSTRCSGLTHEAGYYQGTGFTITPV